MQRVAYLIHLCVVVSIREQGSARDDHVVGRAHEPDGEAATGGQVEWAPPPVNFVHNEQIQWSAVKPPIIEAIESGVQRRLNACVCVCVCV